MPGSSPDGKPLLEFPALFGFLKSRGKRLLFISLEWLSFCCLFRLDEAFRIGVSSVHEKK
ncbi:hypothetical protein DFS30_05470 [Akkermansia muciniphila]|jgi:hypothetical protein|uniref:Uncharacterized protein n=1 Tax=Akkermansia muciniphila TaxID=239935 RepID=A0AAX0WLQ8_9BACT|nr:hypothetical protein CUC06_05430 [Akkermansia muciniphila]MBD9262133.1 hypothetical protein [Akkermansia muciniphila]PNC45109.1 hypothetical protein CXU08_03400 [Akkermansia muciniphila]PNC54511.1 hypothetical protein CXU06_06975 [Akkermansia muciniphila]PNC75801.1 hypothetical protein CXT98_00930 [Akkermansia muciniphila]